MKLLTYVAVAVSVSALLVGCGGNGSGGTNTAPLTKEQVVALLGSGLGQSENVLANNGQTSRSRGKDSRRSRGRVTRDHEGDTTFSFTFNEDTQLWEDHFDEPAPGETPGNGMSFQLYGGWNFYEDHEKTKPAGRILQWFAGKSSEDPFAPDRTTDGGYWEETYLAGTYAGLSFKEQWLAHPDGAGNIEGSGSTPGEGSFEYSGEWIADFSGTWSQKFVREDKSSLTYQYKHNSDNSGVLTINTSVGVKFTINFASDNSGTGSITGNAENLPASIQWATDGAGTITWGDGTTTAIDIYDLIRKQNE